jgi:DNA (cytosine-5)-methyltransferase 1
VTRAAPKRVLDLFCGAGGAAMGLHRVWPDAEIVGVDIRPQKHYSFRFIRADAIDFLKHGDIFAPWGPSIADFIWASPPCQRYSCVTPKSNREGHPDLIAEVADILASKFNEKPYVIENVPGARKLLYQPVMLCGSMFGLRCRRHRLFETNFPVETPRPCDHSVSPLLVTTAGANSRKIGNLKSVKNAMVAYEIDWMTGKELAEAIPPAYSEYLAMQSLTKDRLKGSK